MIRKRYILLLAFVLGMLGAPSVAQAITKQNADEAYRRGNYQQAIADYKELLHQGVSAALYYNLGNAYFRSDSLTQAVLAYERAYELSPGDEDIRFNLQFARSKTIDKITPESEMFFVTWFKGLVNLTGVDTWALLSIVAIIAALLLMLAYLFVPQLLIRKIGFFGSLAFLVIFVCSTVFAWAQLSWLRQSKGAIITAPIVNVKKQPTTNSSEAFVLHEGTRVDITDSTLPGWYGVRVADGREGWVTARTVEKI